MEPQQALDRYEDDILQITCKCPRFWRDDARQELRLCVLQMCKLSHGKLNDDFMGIILKRRFKQIDKLERNRGMRYAPDDMDLANLEQSIRQGYYKIDDRGHKLKIHNHL